MGTRRPLAWNFSIDPQNLPGGIGGVEIALDVLSLRRSGEKRLDRQVATCLISDMVDVFEALATPARRAILDELTERNGQTLFEICVRLTMKHELSLTRQAVSQHLAVLEAAGLITTRRDGRYKFHFLDTTPLVHAVVKRWLKPEKKAGNP
jgi:DNA-binding transcriptional ArsR family regulator